ncbi:DeoR/GlpR family transcriptional regulator [Streptomyces sp. A7024]|uniref:DeoR/GlpR family transcriptional regulator n=1 Tax=Streptomyces coryli TaxID=1128680 RepID=A0A6G4U7P4_9ACTN|nr:LacI family DNA-binding transcriptional regulator [Streptomyces coryli]NGN68204.1 DeoR/GlpR family transcriptional regulator [Streptomyces coryli]
MRTPAAERRQQILEVVRGQEAIRLADLAARLNVSPVTVRRDVEALAQQGLLHRSHGAVRAAGAAPERPATAVLGMLVPDAAYYFADIIRGARAAAAEAGARLVLGISGYRPEEDRTQLDRLTESGADALLLSPSWPDGFPTDTESDQLSRLATPAVLVERRAAPGTPAAELDRVSSDHTHGCFLAVRHLAALGHDRIRLVARADSPTATAVRQGFAAAALALDLPAQEPLAGGPGELERAAGQLAAAVAAGETRAVLVHNDIDAIALVQRLHTHGVRVPDDLALIAYDDEMAALADTPLTAVAPPKRAVGEAAVRLALRRMGAAPDPGTHIELLPELRVRESCGV